MSDVHLFLLLLLFSIGTVYVVLDSFLATFFQFFEFFFNQFSSRYEVIRVNFLVLFGQKSVFPLVFLNAFFAIDKVGEWLPG